eukprot:CAMPEP_0176253950 /NCGR_PEP_ID=MMETSP0121_2-20121125/36283_1 /TAXON_ID=160619 /ORGANISM="Kryptoperidinium foliaceum, Strain CCMP 1326" /LENGTH=48 /DNA_ID= /DNA_START= /DNA_END= /DNA_ORIENTATION=
MGAAPVRAATLHEKRAGGASHAAPEQSRSSPPPCAMCGGAACARWRAA